MTVHRSDQEPFWVQKPGQRLTEEETTSVRGLREATLKEVAFDSGAEQLIHTSAQLNSNSHVLYMSRHWVRVGG